MSTPPGTISSWVKKILVNKDYLSGRFQSFLVHDDADFESCLRVLDDVRRVELNRVVGRSALESAAFADMDVDYQLFACRDTRTGSIVGCVRRTPADELAQSETSRAEYRLDLIDTDLLPRTAVATRLAILKPFRKTAASLSLLETGYRWSLENHDLLGLQACEPGLFNAYLRLGFRPIGPAHSSSTGGFRVPMVFVNHDRRHLERCRSPLLRVLKRANGNVLPQEGTRWYSRHIGEEGEIETGVQPFNDEDSEVHAAITENMTDEGKRALLANAMKVSCDAQQPIIEEDDGGRWIGIVESGLVQVERNDRTVALMGEGEPFGEMAVVLDRPRTARVRAAVPHTKVILLSQSAIDRLTNPSDREVLWQNLAKLLARRLLQR